jgi:hypothetical protein
MLELTSVAEPTLFASGNATRLGTKKTGNHFANTVAPGENWLYNSPPIGAKRNVANSAPHPLNDAGKVMAYLINSSLKISFIPNRLIMATYGLGLDSETGSSTADVDSFKFVAYRRTIKFAPQVVAL